MKSHITMVASDFVVATVDSFAPTYHHAISIKESTNKTVNVDDCVGSFKCSYAMPQADFKF